MDEVLLENQSTVSGRYAVVIEEGGHSVWVYLTEAASTRPVCDVPLVSRVDPIPLREVRTFAAAGGPPPIGEGYLAPGWKRDNPLGLLGTIWSTDGEAVCILIDGVPCAILNAAGRPGAARAILKLGPWGRPWDDAEYQRLFPSPG